MITVGEFRKATEGMSDAAEMELEVVPDGRGWRLEVAFEERPAPAPYNANALIPGASPSVTDPRD